jgi:hypothetical protein
MRTQDEIRIEVTSIHELKIIFANRITNQTNDKRPVIHYELDKQEAFQWGLMLGRQQALKWVLGDTDELYENYQ